MWDYHVMRPLKNDNEYPAINPKSYICFQNSIELISVFQKWKKMLHSFVRVNAHSNNHSEDGGHSYISQQMLLRKELRYNHNLLHLY